MPKLQPRNFSNLKHIQIVEKKHFRALLKPFPEDCARLDLDQLTDEALFQFFASFDAAETLRATGRFVRLFEE